MFACQLSVSKCLVPAAEVVTGAGFGCRVALTLQSTTHAALTAWMYPGVHEGSFMLPCSPDISLLYFTLHTVAYLAD